jgi:hypothetical protein
VRLWALLALSAGACSPAAPPPPAPLAFDCAAGYEALARRIAAHPGMTANRSDPGEPYRFFTEAGGSVSYVVTQPGAPGHPAIVRQAAVTENGAAKMVNTGCPYGDPKGYAQLTAYLDQLAASLKPSPSPKSPTP